MFSEKTEKELNKKEHRKWEFLFMLIELVLVKEEDPNAETV